MVLEKDFYDELIRVQPDKTFKGKYIVREYDSIKGYRICIIDSLGNVYMEDKY